MNRFLMKRRPVKAFSLIELMVVVAIMMILITLLSPALKGVYNHGRDIQCSKNLGTFARLLISYAEDHGEFPHRSKRTSGWKKWYESLIPYTAVSFFTGRQYNNPAEAPLTDFGVCPAYEKKTYRWVGLDDVENQTPLHPKAGYTSTGKDDFKFGVSAEPLNYVSYGINSWLSNSRMITEEDWLDTVKPFVAGDWGRDGVTGVHLDQVVQPSETLLMAEVTMYVGFSQWDTVYHNPNHENRAKLLKVDGSVEAREHDPTVRKGEVLWSNNLNKRSREQIQNWGYYLSPKFAK